MNKVVTKKLRCKKRPIVSGVIYLGLGLYFWGLMEETIPLPEQSWPLFIIIVGIAFIVGSLFKRKAREEQPESNVS